MLHSIPTEKLGAFGQPMTRAVQACVHCGFCLAACPTYVELGQEMDTPRGRIVLMKQVLEGSLPWESAQPHIDRCLGCLACEPACPSGVAYRDLINPFRTLMRSERPATRSSGLRRFLEAHVLPFPRRFRIAIAAGRVARSFSACLPCSIRPMLDLLPDPAKASPSPPLEERAGLPSVAPAKEGVSRPHSECRGRVAFLTGCVQQVLEPDINAATAKVLAHNGFEVVIPPHQCCCGGLAWHTGDLALARKFARQNIAAFPADVDAIVTNAVGCGSTMQEYHLILKGTAEEERAKAFCGRVVDVSVFLARNGLSTPAGQMAAQRIVYQDACHLAHAQRVWNEPRSLLKSIPGLQLLELPEPHLCCGSAGTYNLDQPEIAASLGRKKAEAILATGADAVVSGNIGCITQLRMHLAKLGASLPVRHTLQLLRDAYAINK
jgi:glycolate oxidase iron-sulfur subunit